MKAQRFDIITALPQAIIESILCLLPIEEAARTSILSKEWRFKWTKIPKLKFDETTVKESSEETHLSNRNKISYAERERRKKDKSCKLFYAIYQVLLQRQGPIHEFTLSMVENDTCFELDQMILHLSRNHTLKKLALDLPCRLPLSVFSLHHLTDLYLEYCDCDVDLKLISNGLGSLTSLTLNNMWLPRETLPHLLSRCPSLKRLCIMHDDQIFDENLNIVELFKCLPLLENLTTCGYMTMLAQDPVPGELPPYLIHLKYFCIEQLWFGHSNGLAFLGTLFKCSPNLEKIKLEIETDDDYGAVESTHWEEEYCAILEKYSDVWLEHLSELEIRHYRDVKLELELLKFILARSPNLKKVILRYGSLYGSRKELKRLRALLRPPHATPVEFLVVNY